MSKDKSGISDGIDYHPIIKKQTDFDYESSENSSSIREASNNDKLKMNCLFLAFILILLAFVALV